MAMCMTQMYLGWNRQRKLEQTWDRRSSGFPIDQKASPITRMHRMIVTFQLLPRSSPLHLAGSRHRSN